MNSLEPIGIAIGSSSGDGWVQLPGSSDVATGTGTAPMTQTVDNTNGNGIFKPSTFEITNEDIRRWQSMLRRIVKFDPGQRFEFSPGVVKPDAPIATPDTTKRKITLRD